MHKIIVRMTYSGSEVTRQSKYKDLSEKTRFRCSSAAKGFIEAKATKLKTTKMALFWPRNLKRNMVTHTQSEAGLFLFMLLGIFRLKNVKTNNRLQG